MLPTKEMKSCVKNLFYFHKQKKKTNTDMEKNNGIVMYLLNNCCHEISPSSEMS